MNESINQLIFVKYLFEKIILKILFNTFWIFFKFQISKILVAMVGSRFLDNMGNNLEVTFLCPQKSSNAFL